MTSRSREHIVRLLKGYTAKPSTEEMLCLIAEPSGMLEACKWLIQQSGANDRETKEWIDGACHDHKVNPHKFLSEIQHILSLFTPIHATDLSLYALFDLQPGASREDVKQRYRQLCRRYHPDTALGANEQRTEAFITITKAYHTLLNREEENNQPAPAARNHQWRQQSAQENRNELKRKNILWFSILAIVLAVFSLLAARTYNTHVMMTGLRNKGTAFVPPQRKTAAEKEQADRRTAPPQERIEVDRSPEEPAAPSPAATAKAAPLATDSETPVVVANMAVPSQSIASAEDLRPTLAPSPHQESAQEKKDVPAPAAPVSRPPEQRVPAQVTLNKSPEQTAPGSDLQLSRTKEATTSTSRPEEKPLNKSLAVQPSKMPVKESPVTEKKVEPTPISVPAGNNQRLMPQAVQVAAPSSPRPSLDQLTQKQIETFLQDYATAYQQKNLLAFSRFFALDATENGKSLKNVLTDYTQLFEATESLRLGISLLNWQQNKTALSLHGRFTIALMYKGGKKSQGHGAIDFQLADNQGKWEIKALTYAFDE